MGKSVNDRAHVETMRNIQESEVGKKRDDEDQDQNNSARQIMEVMESGTFIENKDLIGVRYLLEASSYIKSILGQMKVRQEC